MNIIQPIDVTDARLTATNVPEDGYNEWQSGTTYAKGDRVQVTDTDVHRVYESLVDSNSGNYPPDTTEYELGSDAKWLKVSATNPWAMFSDTVGEVTAAAESYDTATYAVDTVDTATGIAVTIQPDALVNGVAAFNIEGKFADLIMKASDGTTLYSERKSLVEDLRTSNWYAYFFEPYSQIGDAITFEGLPLSNTATIHFSINGGGQAAECGVLALGERREIGITEYGSSTGIVDFSRKERDQFGNFNIVERSFAKETSLSVKVPCDRASTVQRTLAKNRARATVFEGAGEIPATLVYGFYREFDISLDSPTFANLEIDIEGLV